ncbi:MAG: hypothetical protein JSV00_03720 [bacterium]|nr:MAG: hypothetical protein JSV00_03720 [bacterium]
MPAIRYLPPVAVAVSAWRLLRGRLSFPREKVGTILAMEDGEVHAVFREMRVAPARSAPRDSMAVLRVRFRFASFSPAANRLLSLIPIPVIAGMPGLRRQIWTFSRESGYSQGIYQFESADQAGRYRRSPVMRILQRRSVPGSTFHELLRGTLLEDYLRDLEGRAAG